VRSRLRQRAIVSLLKTNDSPPKILASQLFFLFDVAPQIDSITDNMTVEKVLVVVGNILRSQQRLQEDVTTWTKELLRAAGLPFMGNSASGEMDLEENTAPVPGLSVVSSQPATLKTMAPPVSGKRKTRRVYLEFAVKLLERGSCNHRILVDSIMKQYPALNRGTVETFVSDVQNEKYSPIRDRKVVKQPDGTMIFEDRIKPTLTLIENPNFSGAETKPVTDIDKQASFSIGDV